MTQNKLPKEIQAMFDRYVENFVRRLKRDKAIEMLVNEFKFTDEQAASMFKMFDVDGNGALSIWEFEKFYTCVGKSASDMVEKFEAMDKDGSGKLDVAEATEGLRQSNLGENEIKFFIDSSKGKDGLIDIAQFASLLFKLKLYDGKKK